MKRLRIAVSVFGIIAAVVIGPPAWAEGSLAMAAADTNNLGGVVLGDAGVPLVGALVTIYTTDQHIVDSVFAGPQGRFSICLPPGNYLVAAEAPGYIREYHSDCFLGEEALPVCVSVKQSAHLVMQLTRGGAIGGQTTVGAARPALIMVSAVKVDFPFYGWRCDRFFWVEPHAEYHLDGLLPGHYRVFARGAGYRTQFYPFRSKFDEAEILYVPENGTVGGIDFALAQAAAGFITGQVKESGTGRLLPGIEVSAFQWSPLEDDPCRAVATTDSSGRFLLSVTSGDYYVVASVRAPGTDGRFVRLFYDRRLHQTLADPVSVSPGATVTNVDFEFDPLATHDLEITGCLYDRSTGAAIAWAKVTAIDLENGRAVSTSFTRPSGSFEVRNLCSGAYILEITGSNVVPCFWPGVLGWQQAQQFHLRNSGTDLYNGGAITQDYGTPGLSISGQVRSADGPVAGARVYAIGIGNDMVAFSRSGPDGAYEIASGLCEGTYYVFADLFGYEGGYYGGVISLDLIQHPRVENIDIILNSTLVGVEDSFVLHGPQVHLTNFPNPFNSRTTIVLAAPTCGQSELLIYDITGRLVRRLVVVLDGYPTALAWDGRDEQGVQVASGLYFYQLRGTTKAKRMLLIK